MRKLAVFCALFPVYATAGILFFMSSAPARAAVTLSTRSAIPEYNIAVSQTNIAAGVNIQTRHTSTEWRCVSQGFKWTSDMDLDALGIYISSNQTTWTSDQPYVLVIQELDSCNGTPVSLVKQINFTMPRTNVVPNQWLHFDVDDVALTYGQWYGFEIGPSTNIAGAVMYWGAVNSDGYYTNGSAKPFYADVSGLPKTDVYGSAGKDLTFYLQLSSPWIYAGNEMEEVVDAETGKTVRYLSSGEWFDNHFHFHNISWGVFGDHQYLFFESSRPRPAGAGTTVPGEKQIMAANAETGDLYYLTTIVNYTGSSALTNYITDRPYYATYNPVAKTIFHFDKALKRIYAYDCISGVSSQLMMLPSGAMARSLHDCVDSEMIRLVYPYTKDGDPDRIAVADFNLDWTLITNRVVVTATNDALNHTSFPLLDKSMFSYKQYIDKDEEKEHFWIYDMEANTNFDVSVSVYGTNQVHIGHMVWGKSGDYIYWSNGQTLSNVCCYSVVSNTADIRHGISTYHNQISWDETLWCYDGGSYQLWSTNLPTGGTNTVKVKNGNGHIGVYNIMTETDNIFASIILADPHPRHAHPQFSPDDTMISFVAAADTNEVTTKVGVVVLDE